MPNKKRLCTNCKKRKDADKGIPCPIGFFCDEKCRREYGIKRTQALQNKTKERVKKEFNKETARKKREFRASDLKTRKKYAVIACHSYIRERDKEKGCITCGRSLIGVKFDAGHFLKATNSYTKFMEKNIHGQCVRCNQYRGGEESIYRDKILEIYGVKTLRALERCKSRTVKRTADDYKKIEEYYKQKLKELLE